MSAMTDLPVEIVCQIFSYLPPSDLKSAALVCRSWEAMVVGEHKLWAWAIITINTLSDVKIKLEVPRFKQIKIIRFKKQPMYLEEVLENLLVYPSIKTIYGMVGYWVFSSVKASVVAGVLGRLDELRVGYGGCYLCKSQHEHLFTAIARREEPMQKLFVRGDSVVSVLSPAVIAPAVTNVKQLDWWDLCSDQIRALLRHIVEEDVPLAILRMTGDGSLENIAPDLVGSALNMLEEVELSLGVISNEQATAVLKGVVEGGSKLKKLRMGLKERLDTELVRQAEQKLGEFF